MASRLGFGEDYYKTEKKKNRILNSMHGMKDDKLCLHENSTPSGSNCNPRGKKNKAEENQTKNGKQNERESAKLAKNGMVIVS